MERKKMYLSPTIVVVNIVPVRLMGISGGQEQYTIDTNDAQDADFVYFNSRSSSGDTFYDD
jgi:hypothetical protein